MRIEGNMERDETLYYIGKAKNGDDKAKQILLERNAPLLKSIIRRFRNKGVEYDDLFQIACIGFLKAINNFDESHNVKFSTYTVPMVAGEIKRYMRDNGAIKVSRTLKILANKINRYIDFYQTTHDSPPSIEHLAKAMGVDSSEIVIAMDSSKMPISLFEQSKDDDNDSELIDKIPSKETADDLIDKIQLGALIESLPERERKIIILRYFRDRTQSEIAESMGISQVQISRLESKILEKIRLKF